MVSFHHRKALNYCLFLLLSLINLSCTIQDSSDPIDDKVFENGGFPFQTGRIWMYKEQRTINSGGFIETDSSDWEMKVVGQKFISGVNSWEVRYSIIEAGRSQYMYTQFFQSSSQELLLMGTARKNSFAYFGLRKAVEIQRGPGFSENLDVPARIMADTLLVYSAPLVVLELPSKVGTSWFYIVVPAGTTSGYEKDINRYWTGLEFLKTKIGNFYGRGMISQLQRYRSSSPPTKDSDTRGVFTFGDKGIMSSEVITVEDRGSLGTRITNSKFVIQSVNF